MIFTIKPGAPALPFPTALPGLGAYIQTPISGQHASNPDKLRTYTLRPRTARTKETPNQRWHWTNSNFSYPPQTTPVLQNRASQRWLGRIWSQQLTPSQRAAWATFASAHLMTNFYGQTKYFSPFGCFMRMNRLFLSDWSIPGYWPTDGTPTQFMDAPTTWPAIPLPTITNLALQIWPPPVPTNRTPYWLINFTITWPPGHNYNTILIYLSYPGKNLNARKQGPMFFAAGTYIISHGPENKTIYSHMWHPALSIGKTISLAYMLADPVQNGESPLSWRSITATPYP